MLAFSESAKPHRCISRPTAVVSVNSPWEVANYFAASKTMSTFWWLSGVVSQDTLKSIQTTILWHHAPISHVFAVSPQDTFGRPPKSPHFWRETCSFDRLGLICRMREPCRCRGCVLSPPSSLETRMRFVAPTCYEKGKFRVNE